MKIFLIGFPGSGKTTGGKRLAGLIGYDFSDTDRLIERRAGMTVAEIFADRGEAAFRKMEHDILSDLCRRDCAVISTGGGMPCHSGNMDLMLSAGKVVYLKTSPEALAARLMHSPTERPLIKGKTEAQLQQYIREKLAEREPTYQRAHLALQTEDFSMEQLLQMLGW